MHGKIPEDGLCFGRRFTGILNLAYNEKIAEK